MRTVTPPTSQRRDPRTNSTCGSARGGRATKRTVPSRSMGGRLRGRRAVGTARSAGTSVAAGGGSGTFGGNFGTNARGSGTPEYGPFGEAVSRLRMVVSSEEGARVLELSNREEIRRLAGHHGLCGLVTELDVRVGPVPGAGG